MSLSRKEEPAPQLNVPSPSRSALARALGDCVAAHLPARPLRVLGAGGSAPQDSRHQVPAPVSVGGRRLSTGQLSARPPQPRGPRRGGPPQTGPVVGSPQTVARNRRGGQPQPTAAGTLRHAGPGLWPTVGPGRVLRVGVVRRPTPLRPRPPRRRKPRPPLEAFFTTELPLSPATGLAQARDRGAVAIPSRASQACAGFGPDPCRKRERVVGAHTLRLRRAAARTLGFVDQTRRAVPFALQRARPWYRQQCAPSQRDLVWACREALQEAGVFPILRFTPELATNPEVPEIALPVAA